jgi:DNA-binding GntR family transcriptional regulator
MRQAMRTAKKANDSPYREYREFAAEDARFHDIVAAASGNAALRETLERLRPHVHLYRLYFRGGLASETLSEHEAVLSAIRAGLPAEAEAAMADHIERSRERLIDRADAARA